MVPVPAAAAVRKVTVPLVAPERTNVPAVVPATPKVGVADPETVFAVAEVSSVPAAVVAGNTTVELIQFAPSDCKTVPEVPAVFGYAAVVAVQFVPSARKRVPVKVAVDGNVAVDHDGAPDAPDRNTCPAVAVPDSTANAEAPE